MRRGVPASSWCGVCPLLTRSDVSASAIRLPAAFTEMRNASSGGVCVVQAQAAVANSQQQPATLRARAKSETASKRRGLGEAEAELQASRSNRLTPPRPPQDSKASQLLRRHRRGESPWGVGGGRTVARGQRRGLVGSIVWLVFDCIASPGCSSAFPGYKATGPAAGLRRPETGGERSPTNSPRLALVQYQCLQWLIVWLQIRKGSHNSES